MSQQAKWWLHAALCLCAAPGYSQQGAATPIAAEVVVTGKQTDTEARRDFIAGKIIISRKRIEDSGAEHVDELLKREPAVSVGSDGRIGLLGLPGYTQVLVDGAAPEAGQGIDQIKLIRVEKIEIVKSAVAEYGPFGIAGTINIITRKVRRQTSTRVGVSTGVTDGQPAASMTLAHEQSKAGSPLRFGVNLGAGQNRSSRESQIRLNHRAADQVIWDAVASGRSRGNDVTASADLAWDGGNGQSLRLSPNGGEMSSRDAATEQRSYQNAGVTHARIASHSRLTMAHLPLNWIVKPGAKSELEVQARVSRIGMDTAGRRTDSGEAGEVLRESSREALARTRNLEIKYKAKLTKSHDIKLGASVLHTREAVRYANLIDGLPDASFDFLGGERHARNRQARIFAQDDWRFSESLAFNAGLSAQQTAIDLEEAGYVSQARFRVSSPSVHLVKDIGGDDSRQLRLSLARTNRAPDQDDLSLRPGIHPLAPCAVITCGANTIDTFDSAGNPALRPERALGLNVSYEHGIGKDSTVTVEVYARRITGKIGTSISEEIVPWSSSPRFVSRPANLGDAQAQGVNLELDLALRDLSASAPKVNLRGAVNLASSRVSSLPGPDNRLDKQTPWSAKLGGSYKLVNWPVKVDLDARWSPGVWVRSNLSQRIAIDRSFNLNGSIGWTISADRRLHLSFGNLAPRTSQSIYEYQGREGPLELITQTRKHRTVSLRFDTKL